MKTPRMATSISHLQLCLTQVSTLPSATTSSTGPETLPNLHQQEHRPCFQVHQPSLQPNKFEDLEPKAPLTIHLPHPWAPKLTSPHCIPFLVSVRVLGDKAQRGTRNSIKVYPTAAQFRRILLKACEESQLKNYFLKAKITNKNKYLNIQLLHQLTIL